MFKVLLVCSLSILCVNSEYLTRKLCKDVDASACDIHNVMMDPCPRGPGFCTIKRNKHYTLTMDFTPRFSAQSLQLSLYGDDTNAGVFDEVVKIPGDACDLMTCPIEENTRRIFDIDFMLGKTFAVAKFPVKVKLWNKENESEACCFTFNVKVSK